MSLDDVAGTSEVTLDASVDCDSSVSGLCRIFKATVDVDPATGPISDPNLNQSLTSSLKVLIVLRARDEQTLCSNRWVMLDAGGLGGGYASQFGNVPPGSYSAGGSDAYVGNQATPGVMGEWGDDLVTWLVEDGYVVADVMYYCREGVGGPCADASLRGWVSKDSVEGAAWYLNTNGTGYLGISSRAHAIYKWGRTNSGGKPICAHGQSSGSGRLIGVMTRWDTGDLFHSVVFSGGPVFSYIPWMCNTDGGPLGVHPETYPLDTESQGGLVPATFDCANTTGNNDSNCSGTACADHVYSTAMLRDSHFYHAFTHGFPDTNVAVVIGGVDESDAWKHILLWLRGHTYGSETIPGLSAGSLTLTQGFCSSENGTWTAQAGGGTRSCSEWNPSSFAGLAPSTTTADTYDGTLSDVPHALPGTQDGANLLHRLTLEQCSQ
jgi:hypothetical protein